MISNSHTLLSLIRKSFPVILINTIGYYWMLVIIPSSTVIGVAPPKPASRLPVVPDIGLLSANYLLLMTDSSRLSHLFDFGNKVFSCKLFTLIRNKRLWPIFLIRRLSAPISCIVHITRMLINNMLPISPNFFASYCLSSQMRDQIFMLARCIRL